MINKITIVGGGTAGLISALILKTRFKDKELEIIKSDKIGIIGVGEGTTEHWSNFMNYVGIDQKELIQGWFVPTMADLNQSNPYLLKYLIQNAIWWIEYAQIDGFRVDTYPYNNSQQMISWLEAIRNQYPDFNIVGEGWMHNSIHLSFWQEKSPIAAIQDFDSKLPSVMDFALNDALVKMFKENNSNWWR